MPLNYWLTLLVGFFTMGIYDELRRRGYKKPLYAVFPIGLVLALLVFFYPFGP